ncbi:MAG: DMT family transporter [Gallionella sp.]|jgi:drug/metabolite transporter (DMT)-like permease|nr:DMT family transporter [Gallionella sp.]MDO9054303.1 DMT family transporter [Gallionella sp.]MDP1594003.1 DMT family transporter [Gallionella sp.]MDP1940343.1 DMT family transporter [Gallionella sp.]
MNWKEAVCQPGIPAAIGAALLFGTGTPLAKWLLESVDPWLLAGLLYSGSGIGLLLYRRLSHAPAVQLPRREIAWFAGAILAGGIVGPVLLMIGLTGMQASAASLLLNAESVFTALLAWFVFRENFDRRIALGMLAIVAGAVVLSWSGDAHIAGLWPMLAILGACLAWGIDNNLTRKVSLTDATWIASVKGLVSGGVNLTLALWLGASIPALPQLAGAMLVGLLAYGVSLTMFVVGLRHLGTARTGAYFSIAPFFGALLAVLMGEPVTSPLLLAGALMALGTWLHLTEYHEHRHIHAELMHDHDHTHDEHHQHEHDSQTTPGSQHRHLHRHEPLTHAHRHFPDAHHQHKH